MKQPHLRRIAFLISLLFAGAVHAGSLAPRASSSKFKAQPKPRVERGMTYATVNTGVAVSRKLQTNAGAPLRFETSPWLAVRAGFEATDELDWGLALEPEFAFYQPNARIEGILGIRGFDARADLDIYNLALNAVGKWNFTRDWQLFLGVAPVISHLEASNARFILNGASLAPASADDTELGFQVLGGLRWFFADHWALNLEGRFLRVDDYTLVFPAATVVSPIESAIASLGVSYHY